MGSSQWLCVADIGLWWVVDNKVLFFIATVIKMAFVCMHITQVGGGDWGSIF